MATRKVVAIAATDGTVFQVPLEQAVQMGTIQNILDDLEEAVLNEDGSIPLTKIGPNTFGDVVKYLDLDAKNPLEVDPSKVEIEIEGLPKEYTLADWESKFFDALAKIHFDKIIILANASDELHYQRLTDAITTFIAKKLEGLSKEEMGKLLHIVDDITLTEADKRDIKKFGLTFESPFLGIEDMKRFEKLHIQRATNPESIKDRLMKENLTEQQWGLIRKYNLTDKSKVETVMGGMSPKSPGSMLNAEDNNLINGLYLSANSKLVDVESYINNMLADNRLNVTFNGQPIQKMTPELRGHLAVLLRKLSATAKEEEELRKIINELKAIHNENEYLKMKLRMLNELDLEDPDFNRKMLLVQKLVDNENIERKYGWLR